MPLGAVDAGGEGAQCAVHAGVGVAADQDCSRLRESLFDDDLVADAGSDVEEMLQPVRPHKLAYFLMTGGGLLVRRGSHDRGQ